MAVALLMATGAMAQPDAASKSESFDRDPGWEAHNNRIPPKPGRMVQQDFGYSATHFAGAAAGEIGGHIQRSTTPASYAAPLADKSLDDVLEASGSFAINASQPGAGVFFGWFQSQQPGGSGRPIGSLGLNLDFEREGGRLAVRLITGGNRSCGTFITPYLPGQYRPTPLKNDGTRYHWTLRYDPQAKHGDGQFTFTLKSGDHPVPALDAALSVAAQAEARRRFPFTSTFTVDLPPGFRQENARFDRFGLMNMMKTGGATTLFFGDLQLDGHRVDLAKDPAWIGAGNRVAFEEREQVGAHDFGYSEDTSHAGGKAGEVGGSFWRTDQQWGYYADRVGALSLEQRLEACGRIQLVTAGPDSDMYFGWFNSAATNGPAAQDRNFLGIHVGGPTRVGHYFEPQYATGRGQRGKAERGPLLKPGKVCEWSLLFDPAADGGHGEMRATLGGETVVLPLKPGRKTEGADFDRFGFFTARTGGQMVKIYFDDLTYSAGPQNLKVTLGGKEVAMPDTSDATRGLDLSGLKLEPLYAADFTRPLKLVKEADLFAEGKRTRLPGDADWVLEGQAEARLANGRLVLKNGGGHLVCWNTREFPADVLIEFGMEPANPQQGLAILFFAAKGRDGGNIFDPAQPLRDGVFKTYHSGALDCYHVSYWATDTNAAARGTAHIRKNHGFQLVALGRDFVAGTGAGPHRIRVLKLGDRIAVEADGKLEVRWQDDGRTFGPVLKSGLIGLRQMAHTGACSYTHFKVWAVKKEQP